MLSKSQILVKNHNIGTLMVSVEMTREDANYLLEAVNSTCNMPDATSQKSTYD